MSGACQVQKRGTKYSGLLLRNSDSIVTSAGPNNSQDNIKETMARNSERKMGFQMLPLEVQIEISSNLPIQDLLSCSVVCRE